MSGPQAFVIQNDTALVWDSYGLAGGISVERLYPGWELRVSQWDTAWVWNNTHPYIDGGVAVERFYPNWEIRCSPWDAVWVWNNAGVFGIDGGYSVERWYPDWTITCSPWDSIWVWNNARSSSVRVNVLRVGLLGRLGRRKKDAEALEIARILAQFLTEEYKRRLH